MFLEILYDSTHKEKQEVETFWELVPLVAYHNY